MSLAAERIQSFYFYDVIETRSTLWLQRKGATSESCDVDAEEDFYDAAAVRKA